MKYFEFYEILYAFFGAAILGMAFGSVRRIFFFLPNYFLTFKDLIFESIIYSNKKAKNKKYNIKFEAEFNKIPKQIIEFFYAFLFFIFFILFIYLFCDGIFRLYLLAISCCFLYAFDKSAGLWFFSLYSRLFTLVFGVLHFIFKFLFFPVRVINYWTFKLLINPLIKFYKFRRDVMLFNRKSEKICRIFS